MGPEGQCHRLHATGQPHPPNEICRSCDRRVGARSASPEEQLVAKKIDLAADWKKLMPHPVAALFPPSGHDEYETLKQDILERGQQEPILLYEGQILDGKARWRACMELDIVPSFAEWGGDQTTLAAWLQAKGANLSRRHLTAEQRAAVLLRAADVLPDVQQAIQTAVGAAELRKQLGMKAPKQADASGEVADIIGRLVGVSGSTVKRVRRVQEKAPDKLQDVAAGRTTCGKVLKEIEDVADAVPVPAGAMPVKKYKLIYADLSDTDLESTPVSAWGGHKSAIALWTPPARLAEAFVLLMKWGWTYRAMFVWDKGKDTELLLVATRNHPPLVFADKVVIKDKPKDGGKSELFREILLHTFPDTEGWRLDLFSKPVPEGWDQPPAAAAQ